MTRAEMNEYVILWQQPDGTISTTVPARPPLEGESIGQWLDGIALRFQNAAPQLHQEFQLTRLPNMTRTAIAASVGAGPDGGPSGRFRWCWRYRNGQVVVDMALARQQRLKELREERDGRFPEADKAWMRAVGQKRPADADQWEQYRQALRDLPATAQTDLDRLLTPSALETYQPDWPETP